MGPTKYVEFYQNIGILVMRFWRSIAGNLCKECIHKHFWSMTGVTLLFGWWGVISFIITPFILLNNIVRYTGALGLPPIVWIGLGLAIFIRAVVFSGGGPAPATPTPTKRPTSILTAGPVPQNTPRATSNPIESLGCVKWSQVRQSHVGKEICIYGIVTSVKAASSLYTIQFSDDWYDFKLQDWNYPDVEIEAGMCIVVAGKVTDNVSFLMLLVSKEDNAIQIYHAPRDCR